MKIVVYAIAKNEEDHVLEWYETMKEADEIYVLDTGSTDRTMELLAQCPKVTFKQKIFKPWRFDVARNESLAMVPEDADICCATDIDDRFDPGWRKILEDNWGEDVTRVSYTYALSTFDDGTPRRIMYNNKFHRREGYYWVYPVHEVVTSSLPEKQILVKEIVLKHCPKPNEPRSDYTELLEFAVKELPNDSRQFYMLGREYTTNKRYDKAIRTLHKYLDMSCYVQEISSAYRFLATCYVGKGYHQEAIYWYNESIKATPDIREPYYWLGREYFSLNKYVEAYPYFKKAESIKEVNSEFPNDEETWNGSLYDYLCICCHYKKRYAEAVKYAKKALKYFPDDQRIKDNLNLFITLRDEEKNKNKDNDKEK